VKSKLWLLLFVFVLLAVNAGFFLNLRNLPDANYPLILIAINLNLVFLIVVSAVVFRKLIKVYSGSSRHRLRRKITTVLVLYLLVPILLLNLLSAVLVLQSTKEYMSGRIRELSKQALFIHQELSRYEERNLREKKELLEKLSAEEIRSLPFVSYAVERKCDFDLLETEGSYLLCLGDKVVALKKEKDFKESLERFGVLASDLRSFVKAKDIITGVFVFMVVSVGLLAILATVWLSMFFARSISEPVERLTEKAMEISKGNLEVEVEEVKTGDEIEKLSKTFKEMKESLKRLYENLRREKESLKKLLDALPVAVLFRGREGSTFVNRTFLSMFGEQEDMEAFLKKVKEDKNFRLEKLEREEGELYIIEDIRPIVLAERFRVWQDSVRRIAHEIKNPLTPIIKINLERLLRNAERGKVSAEQVKELAQVVLKEVNRINLLVSQFRSLSSDRKVKPEELSLRELLEEIKKVYRHAGLKLEVKGDKRVLGDRNLLKEVFYNLLNNSLEHGAKKVEVSIEEGRLLYKDDGRGLTEEEREHLFEPFFSKNPRGFGIGMSVVKKVVEEHGWEVRVLPSERGFQLEVLFSPKNSREERIRGS